MFIPEYSRRGDDRFCLQPWWKLWTCATSRACSRFQSKHVIMSYDLLKSFCFQLSWMFSTPDWKSVDDRNGRLSQTVLKWRSSCETQWMNNIEDIRRGKIPAGQDDREMRWQPCLKFYKNGLNSLEQAARNLLTCEVLETLQKGDWLLSTEGQANNFLRRGR